MLNMSNPSPNEEEEKVHTSKKSAYDNFADNLLKIEEEDKEAKKQKLKEGIEAIEKSEKLSLSSSKSLTSHLSRLREEAGMSSFVGTSGKIQSGKLKHGEFIALLAREILLIGNEDFNDVGGIVTISKLKEYFKTNRENWELKTNDIEEALKKLEKEKMIPGMEKIGDKELIYFKPVELSNDIKEILKAASGIDATIRSLSVILNWPEERTINTLKLLEKEGLAIIDGENVFFPGL